MKRIVVVKTKRGAAKPTNHFCEHRAAQEDWQPKQQDLPLQSDKLVLSLRSMNKATRKLCFSGRSVDLAS